MVQSNEVDAPTELLIAQLFEEDLRTSFYTQEAERMQLNQALADSALAAGQIPHEPAASVRGFLTDSDIALEWSIADARVSGDAAYAQVLQHSEDVNTIMSQQYAQRIAAIEKKALLDAEYARKLQDINDTGRADIDDASFQDAEKVLGQEVIDQIMSLDPNSKGKSRGKGKGKRRCSSPEANIPFAKVQKLEHQTDADIEAYEDVTPYPTCGICMESFQVTYSPIAASASANSSSRLPFGLRLTCPGSHAYCMVYLDAYIRKMLDPEGDGGGNSGTVVFPIRCPECPITEWVGGIPDEIAEKILPEQEMLWHHQKLLDSLPRHYCPNPRCSALVQLHDNPDEPRAICPSCAIAMCVSCHVIWHDNMTCEEYQALPLDERSPEDQQALQLMKVKNWRRCPNCSFIVELTLAAIT
ncbi:hypothetical protein AcV5_000209 [Taiwanofungus camphoratus]|nr:hypothetical protein AcV5_000209 [Antrodia cinnamomea]